MSILQQTHPPDRGRRKPAGTLDDWENEGGSLSGMPASKPTATARSNRDFSLFDVLPVPILVTDSGGRIIYSNRASQLLFAVSASALNDMDWRDSIDGRDREAASSQWPVIGGDDAPRVFEARILAAAGTPIWTRHSIGRLLPGEAPGEHIHAIEDISRTKEAERSGTAAMEDLSRERERARVTLESIGDAVISTDEAGRVTYLNPVAEQLTGWSRKNAGGQPLGVIFRVIDAETGAPIDNPAQQAIDRLDVVQMPADCLLLRPDGTQLAIEDSAAPILDGSGRLTGAVLIFRDRRLSQENIRKLSYQARHDALTGLPNRMSFTEHFDQALKLASRHGKRVGLLFIDLDDFKRVNDRLGHKEGDRLLRELSVGLTASIRSTDRVCRYGGDEFAVMLSEIERPADAARVTRKLLAAAGSCQSAEIPAGLELSVGISLYPDHGGDMETLIHRADIAMYHAKFDKQSNHCYYHEGMQRPDALLDDRGAGGAADG